MDGEELQAIAETLTRIVTPEMSPKQLLKAAKKAHPRASKKDIARAAYFSIISSAGDDSAKAENLYAFAIAERVAGEHE